LETTKSKAKALGEKNRCHPETRSGEREELKKGGMASPVIVWSKLTS